jgi:hypothetical protein
MNTLQKEEPAWSGDTRRPGPEESTVHPVGQNKSTDPTHEQPGHVAQDSFCWMNTC